MGDFADNVLHLYNQMQATKNSRVNASHRLNSNGSFSEFINVYYSVVTVTLSILSIFLRDSNFGNILSISATILSIALTISITYANSIKFKEKAQRSKDSFTSIQKLQYQLSNIKSDDYETLNRIEMDYTKILEEYDLHIPFDYQTYALESNILEREDRKLYSVKYKSHKCWTCFIKVILVIFPFAFIFFAFLFQKYISYSLYSIF